MQLPLPHTADAAQTFIPFRNLCDFCNQVAEHEEKDQTNGARYCARHLKEYHQENHPMKAAITEFEIITHGIDSPSYFQGCGTVFTRFKHVQTGIGDTPAEAFNDCLEMIAQSETLADNALSVIEESEQGKEIAATCEPSASDEMEYPFTCTCNDCEHDWQTVDSRGVIFVCPQCRSDNVSADEHEIDGDYLHYYLSIRYNLSTD